MGLLFSIVMTKRKIYVLLAGYILLCCGLYRLNKKLQNTENVLHAGIEGKGRATFIKEDGRHRQGIGQENKTDEDALRDFLQRKSKMNIEIDSYCETHSETLPVFEKGFSSLILDKINKITYCSVYKVASTSWGKTLLELRGKYNTKRPIRDIMDQVFKKVSQELGPSRTQDTFKFMIVRHPFERIISAYRSKFENAITYYYYHKIGEKMVRTYRKTEEKLLHIQVTSFFQEIDKYLTAKNPDKDINTYISPDNPYAHPIGPTFEEFIKYVISPEDDDDHWRPYYIQCSMCHMQYDVVLRFENISSDSNLLLKFLNLSDRISSQWENPTVSGPTTADLGCLYFNQITKELVMKLLDKYLHDFQMFNYSYEHYLNCSK